MTSVATRRTAIAGGSLLVLGILGGSAYEAARLFGKHYPPTPYDDLFALLPNRESAKDMGSTFLISHPNFTAATAASALRARIGSRSLFAVLQQEVGRGELTEVGHWVLPQTLAGLCALAAKAG